MQSEQWGLYLYYIFYLQCDIQHHSTTNICLSQKTINEKIKTKLFKNR